MVYLSINLEKYFLCLPVSKDLTSGLGRVFFLFEWDAQFQLREKTESQNDLTIDLLKVANIFSKMPTEKIEFLVS